jgi:hypothetical protein
MQIAEGQAGNWREMEKVQTTLRLVFIKQKSRRFICKAALSM